MTGLSQKITVAMITMNEERAIKKVIGDILAALPDVDVVIVDSSKDRTPEIAESMGVRVIRQFPPKGYGPAMDKALHASDRPVIVTMDCDDTYPVSFIEPMARMVLEDGYDVVDGSRLHNGKPAAMPWFNYFANLGFSMIASVLFFRYLTDLHSGMRAYRTSLLNNLRYTTNGDALPVELLLRPIREGRKVKVIGIPYRIRIGESTMNPIRSAWWTVKRICFARFF